MKKLKSPKLGLLNSEISQAFYFLNRSSLCWIKYLIKAKIVDDAFKEQREFIFKAVGNAKPDEAKLQQLMKPMADKIALIQNYRESKRTSDLFNHLSAISESIPALAWVQVSPTPGPHIKEMSDAAQFYTNRVLKDWKDK